MAGILGKSVRDVYELNGKVDSLSYYDIVKMLKSQGLEYNNELPESNWEEKTNPHHAQFWRPAFTNSMNWYENMKSFIDRGWVGIASIAHNSDGHITGHTDHLVLIVGYEENWVDHPTVPGSRSRTDRVILSCSARNERYTEDKTDFLKFRGGYNAIYVNYAKSER